MKKYLFYLFTFFSSCCFAQSEAQGVRSDTLTDPVAGGTDILDFLPPLAVLIDSAIANSPNVEMSNYRLKASEYEVGRVRRDWSELIVLNGHYRITDYDRLTFDETGVPLPQQALGYQLSAGVQVPLSYFVNRKNVVRQAEMNVLSAKAEKKSQEEMIVERVIATYNELLLIQRLLVITAEAKESADLILEMAEDRFRDGEITLDELGSSTSMKADFASEQEQLRAQFRTTYAMLEQLVGMPLGKLQNLNE